MPPHIPAPSSGASSRPVLPGPGWGVGRTPTEWDLGRDNGLWYGVPCGRFPWRQRGTGPQGGGAGTLLGSNRRGLPAAGAGSDRISLEPLAAGPQLQGMHSRGLQNQLSSHPACSGAVCGLQAGAFQKGARVVTQEEVKLGTEGRPVTLNSGSQNGPCSPGLRTTWVSKTLDSQRHPHLPDPRLFRGQRAPGWEPHRDPRGSEPHLLIHSNRGSTPILSSPSTLHTRELQTPALCTGRGAPYRHVPRAMRPKSSPRSSSQVLETSQGLSQCWSGLQGPKGEAGLKDGTQAPAGEEHAPDQPGCADQRGSLHLGFLSYKMGLRACLLLRMIVG
ncbi:uncharacterized protein LOC116572666 [Mustela erminea]|uniref:uncharacterized protein LOC116572666 n=1 Tax=Mustela erminea TaxID=36723 RepID=UPI001386967B|nr:uncharacterized protein LOC116572666 [Mustela erminea]